MMKKAMKMGKAVGKRAASSLYPMNTRRISANAPGTQNQGLGGGSKSKKIMGGYGVKVSK